MRKGETEGRLNPDFYVLKRQDLSEYVYLKHFLEDAFQGETQGTDDAILPIKVLKVRNFDEFGNIDFKDVSYSNFHNQRKLLKKYDIITPFRGMAINNKKFALFVHDEKATIDNNTGVIRLKSGRINPTFVYYYLQTQVGFNQIKKYVVGSAIPAVTKEIIKKIKLPSNYPDLQEKVISLFEAAYSVKRDKEAEVKVLLGGIDVYLLERLGIGIPVTTANENFFYRRLSEITGGRFDASSYRAERLAAIEAVKGGRYSSNKLKFLANFPKAIVSETALPYVGLENIESDTGNFIETSEKETFGSALVFKKNQILFPKLRPYLNKVYYAEFDGVCSTEFHVLDSKSRSLTNAFLTDFLRSKIIVSQTKHLMSGNTLPRLQTEDIENLLIPLPPLEVQEEIAAYILSIRGRARELEREAQAEVEHARAEVERMILGEVSADA